MSASPRSATSSPRWPRELGQRTGLDRRRRLQRNHLPAFVVVAPRPAAEELDPAGDYLQRVPPLPFVLPRAGLEPPVDCDPPALAEVLRAQLGLPVPGGHGHEVR